MLSVLRQALSAFPSPLSPGHAFDAPDPRTSLSIQTVASCFCRPQPPDTPATDAVLPADHRGRSHLPNPGPPRPQCPAALVDTVHRLRRVRDRGPRVHGRRDDPRADAGQRPHHHHGPRAVQRGLARRRHDGNAGARLG
ncbi:hypothetical protein J8273_8138 [Carpediemonas membranifera]|uniref:Uncharacterized protein n=1 Tax=Carpediemonas membranifera TaxID=201153 RepID=A0A8J6DZ89_9EUKA|nr:hypothetical protein J8273_8138 [Carpediemonas membranifera]|eukprot:KAG9390101.1 hypothetical protein J8273_8138 [Carpediemonas membranifera]